MPRSSSGVYTLPAAPFTPNTIIKSADVNSDLSDIGVALTQSLATTGVSTMTGQIKAFAGSINNPGYSFASALHTGWFLSGTNEISWVANGIVQAVFAADGSVTWNGVQTYAGGLHITGSVTVGSNLTVSGLITASMSVAVAGGLYVTGSITAGGDVGITGNLNVGGNGVNNLGSGSATVNLVSNAVVITSASTRVSNTLYTQGGIVASASITAQGDIYVTGSLSVGASVAISGGLTVVGNVSITGQINSSLKVAGPLYVTASQQVTGGLYVSGEIVASSSVKLAGPLYVSTSVSVTGGLYVGGSLAVANDTSLGGNTNNIGPSGGVINFGAGAVIISTTSVDIAGYEVLDKQAGDPAASIAANKLAIYVKADGFSSTPTPYFITSASVPVPLMLTGGQCRLTKSGTSLLLSPFGGNRLTINGVPSIVPDAGVSLAASNSASVFVYIYAKASAGVVSGLEMSTTAPTAQAGTGIQQKTGDATRTLVGAAFTDTAGAWADTDGKLWVISYFNRQIKASRTAITASTTVSSTTYLEINASMRNNFIAWASTNVQVQANIMAFPGGVGSTGFTQIQDENGAAYDSAAINASGSGIGALTAGPISTNIEGIVTEATSHYATIFGRATSSVTTWILGTAKETNSLLVYVQG